MSKSLRTLWISIVVLSIYSLTNAQFLSRDILSKNNFHKSSYIFSIIDTLQNNDIVLDSISGIKYGRLGLVGGTILGSMVAIHVYQQNGWWRDNRASFHFREDLVYGLSVDKIGHFYGGYFLTFIIGKSLEWANLSEKQALYWSAGSSFLFQTYVEIEDGFSKWGFDRVDFAANLGGSAIFPVARHYIPELKTLDLKLSYKPSSLLGSKKGIGFQGQKHLVIDDYEGQNFWLSVKVHDILPDKINNYWPSFLCIAVGYGARDVGTKDSYPVWFLSFDYDMTKIIPPKTPLLKSIGEFLNFIHFPAPAIRIHPSAIWYGLYF